MNPNTCTICELMFTKVMRARKITIDATIMFADLRGYTSLSQSQSSDAVSSLLDAFDDECANAIGAREGILNKTIGDAVMAVFNFPLVRNEHAGTLCAPHATFSKTGANVARRLSQGKGRNFV